MSTVAEILAQAKAYHAAGQLREAEPCYLSVVRTDAGNVEAHYLLGVVCHALGRPHEAVTSLRQAVRLKADYAEAHHYLGFVLEELGKLDEAITSFQHASRLKPDSAEISKNLRRALATKDYSLGNALAAQGKLDEAAACYRRAVELKPDFAEAFYNLANAAVNQGKLDEAAANYRRALALNSDYAEAQNNLALVLTEQNKLDEAASCCRRALELKPDYAGAHINLARILRNQNKLDEAAACCRRALELNPDFAEAQNTLALVLRDQNKLDEAASCCRRALELRPNFAKAHNNLALVLRDQDRLDEAAACFRRALELKRDFAEAHVNLAVTFLTMGRLAEGWSEFEWRWKLPVLQQPPRSQPAWDGSPLAGRTLLVYAEQGLGDTFQFIRYVPLLESQGGKVILEVQPALTAILSQSGFRGLVPRGAPLPSFDLHAALMSLPSLFKTTLTSIPGGVPYLSANAALSEQWRRKLKDIPGIKIGIVWQGRQNSPQPWRAVPLSAFERIAKLAGVRLVSLQKGFGSEEIAGTAERFSLLDFGPQLDEVSGPFMDTAALMTQLDLVITSDTSTAHLAGGLGVPVWVVLSSKADWRWLRARSDSPWYPTMRLFRQDRLGDWDSVFQEMEAELAQMA